MRKKILFTVLSMFLICCFCTTSFANSITPRYTNIASIYSNLTISGNTATCNSDIRGYRGETTKIEVEQILEKEVTQGNWEEVDSWTQTVNNYKTSFTNTKSNLSKGTYRVITITKVYVGTQFEQATAYSDEKTI